MLTQAKCRELLDKYSADPEIAAALNNRAHPLHDMGVRAINGLRHLAGTADRSGPEAKAALTALMPFGPVLEAELGTTIDWTDQYAPEDIAQAAIGWLKVREIGDAEYQAALHDQSHPNHAAVIEERDAVYGEAFPPTAEEQARQIAPDLDAARQAEREAKAAYDADSTDETRLQAWADAMSRVAALEAQAKTIPQQKEQAMTTDDPMRAIREFEASEKWQRVVKDPAALGRADLVAERDALYRAAYPEPGPDVVAVVGGGQ